jgi:GDP-mannose 4,6-dehydratase
LLEAEPDGPLEEDRSREQHAVTHKRAFITGITGMVGSHLAEYLLALTDWEIWGLARWRSPLGNIESLIPAINQKRRVHLVYGDLRDTLSIREAVKAARPDYVFHLAAQSFPKTSFDAPLDTLETNVQGTVRVLDAIREYAPKAVVHVCSSSEVFGRVPKEKLPIDEECAFHPASPYAISKAGTDLVGRFYAEAYGLCTLTTRMFTHTGPRRGDVFAESTFAKQIAMIEAGLIEPVVKVGNLNSLRTVADVRDAVRALPTFATRCAPIICWSRSIRSPAPTTILAAPFTAPSATSWRSCSRCHRAGATSRSSPTRSGSGRSMPTCKCRTRGNSAPIRAGSRRSPMSRPWATCSTIGAISSLGRAMRS